MALSRFVTSAVVTAMAWGNPIVSTITWRLIPDTFSLRHNLFLPLYPHSVRSVRQQFQRLSYPASSLRSDLFHQFLQENICQGGFHHKNEIPPVKLGLVSQNKVYHIYPTQQSVKNGPPNRVPSRITNYHCQSAAKCDTCLYCFFDSFSFLFIHVYVSSPKFRFET